MMLLLAIAASCAGPPPPTAAAKRLAANPRATIEGRVVDSGGLPIAGVQVQAIPEGRDILWAAPGTTDAEGRFRLTLDAPAEYVFLILEGGTAVLTAEPDDPSRVHVSVQPGETRGGVALTYRREVRGPLLHPLQPTPGG